MLSKDIVYHFTDAVAMHGYPNILRSQEDSSNEGVVVFPDNQAILMPGTISSWKFYALKNVTLLALQIWRQVFDLKVCAQCIFKRYPSAIFIPQCFHEMGI